MNRWTFVSRMFIHLRVCIAVGVLGSVSPALAAPAVGISLGVFPGTVDNSIPLQELIERYQPLARYMETALPGTQVRIQVIRSPSAFKAAVKKQSHQVLFVNPEIAAAAFESGYRFRVAREDAIVGVVLVNAGSTIKDIRGLAGKTIMANREAMVTTLVRAHLADSAVAVKWSFNNVPQQDLPKVATMGFAVDGLVVRREFFASLQKSSPNKWRIVAESPPEHGFMFGFRADFPLASAKALTAAFTALNPTAHAAVLSGFDSGKIVPSRYVAIDDYALAPMRDKLRKLSQVDGAANLVSK